MATRASRRAERLAREVEAIAPRPPDPEELRREDEAFFDSWARDIVRAAHEARERRGRGESRDRPISTCSPLEIMAEAVSYGGHAPPEAVRAALLDLLNEREVPEYFDPEMVEEMNEATREVLRRAFVRHAEETANKPA